LTEIVPEDHKLRITLGAEDDTIINIVPKRNIEDKIRFPCMDCGSPVDITHFFIRKKKYVMPVQATIHCSSNKKHPYTFRWTGG
jgi:hypothetical protein